MELNKYKMFTAEDVKKAIILSMSYNDATVIKLLQQQPTEIAVEIVTRTLCRQIDCVDDARLIESKIVWSKEDPMLDKDGFLILKKKL
jgi:hypothetical protein